MARTKISAKVDSATWQQFQELCKEHDVSMSAMLDEILWDWCVNVPAIKKRDDAGFARMAATAKDKRRSR